MRDEVYRPLDGSDSGSAFQGKDDEESWAVVLPVPEGRGSYCPAIAAARRRTRSGAIVTPQAGCSGLSRAGIRCPTAPKENASASCPSPGAAMR